MTNRFEWVPDVSRGDWLRPMEAEPFDSILAVVPPGFAAYARIFHPVERDRPRATTTWQGIDRRTYLDGVEDFEAALETELVTWATVAASFGTEMNSESSYAHLVRQDRDNSVEVTAADGWRYTSPQGGNVDTVSLAAASAVLARHTATADAGIAAIWEGWGGLVTSGGAAKLTWAAGTPRVYAKDASIRERLCAAARLGVDGVRYWGKTFQRPKRVDQTPGSGRLPSEVATGKRFDLRAGAGRHYILFEAGAHDFMKNDWPASAPWVVGSRWANSPSILWPDDHAWVFATDIDFDSTLVAGSTELIYELLHTPGLEVLPIGAEADLTR